MRLPADADGAANATAALWQRAAAHDPNDVLRVWRDGAWRGVTCTEVADRVRDVAAGLVALGVDRGDRVALLGRSGVQWALADLAVLAAGAVSVPVGSGTSRERCNEILAAAGVRPSHVLLLDDAALDAVAARAGDAERRAVDVRVDGTSATDPAIAVYASDPAEVPQERCLTHGELLALARRPAAAALERRDTVLLCGSPAEVDGHVLLLQSLNAGAALAFPRGPDTVLEDLQSFSPTVVSATAGIFQQLVDATRARSEGQRSRTFDFAVTSAVQWAGREDPRTLDTIRRSIADKLVYRDLRDAMGGQVRHSLCSQGGVGDELAAVFAAADVPIFAAHGAEAAPR